MACLLTATGNHTQALDLLEESLQIEPSLIEWSRQDPDLDALRDNPRFQQMTGG